MQFFSTRDQNRKVTSSQAIAQGLSDEGGLFVPASFPQVDVKALCRLDYPALAAAVVREYLTDYDPTFLTEATRSHPMVRLGISPRGALALCRCAKAAAFAAGRDFVLPEDAAELVPYVFGHRLMLSSRAKLNDYTPQAILAQVLEETPAPAMTERTL